MKCRNLQQLWPRVNQLAAVSPSPLNGERAGVRGGNDRALHCRYVTLDGTTPHPHSLSPLRGEGGIYSAHSLFHGASQRGVALVLTLIMLAIITIVTVVFLAAARRNRQSSTVRKDQTDAEFANETAFQRASAEIITNILAHRAPIGANGAMVNDPNLLAFDFFVSAPLSGAPLGYDVYATNWSIGTTNTRPFLNDEIPIVVNKAGSVDVYFDANRDRQFEDPHDPANTPLGDPIWIGVRDRPEFGHGKTNRFVARYAYLALPVGKMLDLNTIHNAASSTTGYDFKRNQGFGPWELNLAAFLAELHSDVWGNPPNGQGAYSYGPFPSPVAGGTAFIDARSIVEYRHDWGRESKKRLFDVYPAAAVAGAFPPPSIDVYSDGAGANNVGNVLGANIFLLDDDVPSKTGKMGWSGADSANHFFHIQQLFETTNIVTSQFATNLIRAINGYAPDRIRPDPSLYYRLISQLGTDTGSDYHNRINLNYAAIGTNSASDFVPWDANPALAVAFFTNVAERIFLAQSNEFNPFPGTNAMPVRSIMEIPVYPTNMYSTAIHRILQEAANIFDATRTNIYPSVFRPIFGPGPLKGVNYIVGYTNDDRVSTLQTWLNSNTNGIPLIIGAKKGLPNFNEFTMRTDMMATRKIQVTRPGITAKPDGTNQMYTLGISNYFGVEAWNSYQARYPRAVDLVVSNVTTLILKNDRGYQQQQTFTSANATNVPARGWLGYNQQVAPMAAKSFIMAMNTNEVFLTNSVYRFSDNTFTSIGANVFEAYPGFPVPYWVLTVSNRLTYWMTEGNRILDFVVLSDDQTVDLHRELIAGINPYAVIPGISANVLGVWNTNRASANAPTAGILKQLDLALGNVNLGTAEWQDYSVLEGDKTKAIDEFRAFCGLGPLTTNYIATNATLAMQAPFNPAAKLAVMSTWEVNDPLVHYHISDLRMGGNATNHQYLKPSQSASNVAPSSLGYLNSRYSPWGGNPNSSAELGDTYDRKLKDPGVSSSDYWEFPTNKLASIGLLGRIHRGTPWQTIYLKAEAALLGGNAGWTNQSPDLVFVNGRELSRTHPTNDWKLADIFTTAIDERTSRGLMSVNQRGLESWSALLSGVHVLSNNLASPSLGAARTYDEKYFIEPWAGRPFAQSPLAIIYSNIHWFQTNVARPLESVGDILRVPELTVASPFLNLADPDQIKWGLDDYAYERIPQQILSLLRVGEPKYVIYAYGQALKPALIDPATGNVLNYQVTAEFVTRSVVRVEGNPQGRLRTVVESFNVLPPD